MVKDTEERPPPPGWYEDPTDPERQRYWDGDSWTTHTGIEARSKLANRDPMTHGGVVNTWERASFVVTYLLGGLLLGPIAIRYASRAEGARATGDRERAREYARSARTWSIVAGVVGVLTVLVVLWQLGVLEDLNLT